MKLSETDRAPPHSAPLPTSHPKRASMLSDLAASDKPIADAPNPCQTRD